MSAVEVPSATVEARARASMHVNGSRTPLGERLAELPDAVDRTAEFEHAFKTLKVSPGFG